MSKPPFFLLLHFSLFFTDLQAQDPVPNIKIGYTGAGTETGEVSTRHTLEAGYYHAFDYGLFSHGPSATFLVISDYDKLYLGPKLSYEGSFLLVGAKMDLWYYRSTLLLAPSGGLSLLGYGNLHVGYNIGLNRSDRNGILFTLQLNLPQSYRPAMKIGG